MFRQIPLIDFGSFLNGTDEDRQKVSSQIGDACRNVGFFYLSNHGIPSSLIDRVYQQAERFFSQSIEEKMKLYIGSSPYGNNRGYTPMFEEKLSLKGDLKEGFDLANELPPDDQDRIQRGATLYGPNFWPQNLQGFTSFYFNKI
jgi:isopenicillin N synthase-like dioxygenase